MTRQEETDIYNKFLGINPPKIREGNKVCKQCGISFPPKSSWSKYCDGTCKQAHENEKAKEKDEKQRKKDRQKLYK